MEFTNYIREETTEPMAKKYENVEKVRELLDEKQLGQLAKSYLFHRKKPFGNLEKAFRIGGR